MTDAPPIIIDEDAAIDSAFFGSHAGRTCYARAHRSGWVLVVRQVVAQREAPVMLRVWGRAERVPDDDASCWHCGNVAPIRADAALQVCATFRIALPRTRCSARRRTNTCVFGLRVAGHAAGQLPSRSEWCEQRHPLLHRALHGVPPN